MRAEMPATYSMSTPTCSWIGRPVPRAETCQRPVGRGLTLVPGVLPLGVALADQRELGAGTDDAHVAAEHVRQLRQLVEAPLAQEAADAGEARVGGALVAPKAAPAE